VVALVLVLLLAAPLTWLGWQVAAVLLRQLF
jgi:hypothetical protein